MKAIELDVHTHTVASGHAYGTVAEMGQEAARKGLKLLGITEHGKGVPGTCDEIYFRNLHVLPRNQFGISMLFGGEINILDYDGSLGTEERILKLLDIRIAGIHSICYKIGNEEENTNAVISAMRNPYTDIICHPDDGNCPLNYEKLVRTSIETNTLLEINNNSMRLKSRVDVDKNILKILTLCKREGMPVILSSDAHYMTDIANYSEVMKLLEEAEFPEELIINYSVEKFLAFIGKNREKE